MKYQPIYQLFITDSVQQLETRDNLFNSDPVKLVIKQFEELFNIPFPLSSFHVVLVPRETNLPFINAFGLLVFK